MINTGETLKIVARPFDWNGDLDTGAILTFTVSHDDTVTSPVVMEWHPAQASYSATFIPVSTGVHRIRITARLSDDSTSVETRQIEVRS